MYSENLIKWFEWNLFKPNNEISRAEFLKFIFTIFHKNISNDTNSYFLDLNQNSWYNKYVNTALELRLISKTSHFNPNMSVSRAEWLKILLLTVKWNISLKYSSCFLDVKSSDWFASYIQYAWENNLLRDTKTYFYPNKKLTRLEVLYMIFKLNKS